MLTPRGLGNIPRDVLGRLGNVLYWLGIVVAAAPFIIVLVLFLDALLNRTQETFNSIIADGGSGLTKMFAASGIWAGVCYAVGWSLRYILSGAIDHPIKISETMKQYVFWIVLSPMAIWLGYTSVVQSYLWFQKFVGR